MSFSNKNNIEQAKIYRKHIKTIEEWVMSKGYAVIYDKTAKDIIDFEQKVIFINTRTRLENRLFSLLHECGHLIIDGSTTSNKKYPLKAESLRKENSVVSAIEELEEEIEAWRKGKRLSQKLKLSIDKQRYDKYAARFIMSYVKSAADKFNSF